MNLLKMVFLSSLVWLASSCDMQAMRDCVMRSGDAVSDRACMYRWSRDWSIGECDGKDEVRDLMDWIVCAGFYPPGNNMHCIARFEERREDSMDACREVACMKRVVLRLLDGMGRCSPSSASRVVCSLCSLLSV